MIIFAHWDFSSSGTHQDAQFVSLSRRVNNVKTETICQVTLEKILISLEMVGLFSLDTSEGNDRNHILCLLLSDWGQYFIQTVTLGSPQLRFGRQLWVQNLCLNMWGERNPSRQSMLQAYVSLVIIKTPATLPCKIHSPNTFFDMYSWESLKSELWAIGGPGGGAGGRGWS